MSYTIENVNGCTKKLIFNFETLDLTTEIKAAISNKQKSVSLKGFRKGKAPLSMVEQMYGPQLESEALNSFIQTQLFKAVDEEKLRVVGYPTFENMKYEKGKSVSFDALVEIFPEIELKDMAGYSFAKDSVEVTDDDLESMKKNYLNSKAEMVEVEDDSLALDKGLFAVLNFEGEKENGEKPENMKGEEFLLEIGSNQFIPGFEEGMIGMKKGEKKDLDLSFPDSYHVEELKNAKVKFAVELLEIKEKKYPELNDELAKEFGFESVSDFETKNKENLVKQKERQAKEKLNQEIIEKLVSDNSFEVPSTMLKQQEKHTKEDLSRNLKAQGFNDQMLEDYFSKWNEDVTKKADFQVRSGLILDHLAKKYEVQTTDADLEAKIDEMASQSGMDKEQIKQYYTSNENVKNNMMYAIREEKTFEKLISELKVL